MRLRTKHGLALSFLCAVVLSATIAMVYATERRHLREQSEKARSAALEKLVQVCRNSFLEDDELSLLAYLKSLRSSTEPGLLAYAALLDAKGNVLMHSDFLDANLKRKNLPATQAGLQAALRAGGAGQAEAVEGARRLLVLAAPVDISGSRQGTAAIAYDRDALDASIGAIQRGTLLRLLHVAAAALLLSVLVALLLARALAKPIQDLRDGADKIGRGDWKHRIPAQSGDELGELAAEFNLMAERLAELDELKDGFLAQITHDLRNPLAAAMGRIELLLKGYQGSLTDEQKESLAMAMTSAVFLNELITNILDLTKLEAGKMELHPQLLDLSACAASVTGMLQVKADEYGVALDVSGIPAGALVWADEQGLRRVLTNLVSNALKFTPKGGGVRLRWSRLPDGRDRVSVEDTGIGIPKAKLDTLFKKFSQVEETKKAARSPGTGLGLAICKQLVEGHGGTVGVESEYRRGTTFYFELPAGRLAGERSIG